MFVNTQQRTLAPEIMDDFLMEGEILRSTLDQIAYVNRMLGGNSITLSGVSSLMEHVPKGKLITIADIGCGNGDMLRAVARLARKNKWQVKLMGIDANKCTVDYATRLSVEYPEITYYCMDIMQDPFRNLQYDIALCTLTLHHFEEKQIIRLMSVFRRNATLGIVINDLHRSALAYRLFQGFSWIAGMGQMAKTDGLVSILRGFKRNEIEELSHKLNFSQYTLKWKWAFRYQWIITNV
ncbi:methyltransferase domain-containing protein [Chitinophaga rhizophila]|uniref:Methyltransferase domain-containing protein n=1 Tax=Chitinophaga rhizophila TaxID=2866212 RepID=A0ABS7G7I3_9BACT|nr:methyltransferase domain-containing protein [Chitinophaga rhizophila]MBW8682754.1 methyltransferase domain-containing protein [Chitinophaga rhizophila]